jgi:hypothetical protein
MGRYFEAARSVLEHHGGTVEKFIGDAVMAMFGIPQLHEDDALRAVRAAAELSGTLAQLNPELERDYGLRIETRTGVNTGEVVAGEGETLATGDAVNVAARLEQAAPVGEVLLGETTYRLVRDAVTVAPVEPLTLKGKAGPVPAYRLLEVAPGALGHARRLDSPMVGRKREQALLLQAFERAVGDRSCQLFTVLGSAGVGKSRLVAEFLSNIREQATVLRGRCLPYGEGITYWPLSEALKEVAGIHDEDPPDEARRALASLVATEDDADLVEARVSTLLGLADETATAEESFWAVRKLLEALARSQPLIVLFDDVHWAEPTFLDLVENIADWSRDAPILLFCLARPELLDTRRDWGGGKLNATTVLLEPLADPESEELVNNLLGQAELGGEVRSRIVESAEGNPLFVEELLSMLIDEGLLERRDGAWLPTADLSSLAIPPTIQVLLAARLDRLEAEERAVIERASVEGKVFHRGSVAELSPEAARAGVPNRLMTLVRKELIRPDRATFAGEDAFRFRHLLIRDAAYEALSKDARAELHERFAAWLEQKAGERITEYEEILGYHLEQAYRYRAELGPLDDDARDVGARAAALLKAAGVRAIAHEDWHGAANLLSRANDLLPRGDSSRLELVPDLADALTETGDFPTVEALLVDAVESAARLGDPRLEAQLRLSLAATQLLSDPEGKADEAWRTTEQALPIFEAQEDHLGLARLWRLRFGLGMQWNRGDLLEEAAQQAPFHAEHAGAEGARRFDIAAGLTAGVFGPLPVTDAIKRCDEALAKYPGRQAVAAAAFVALGALLAMQGAIDAGRHAAGQAKQIANEISFGLNRTISVGERACLLELIARDGAAAEREIRPGYDLLRSAGDLGHLSTHAWYLAEALYLQGRHEEAEVETRVSEQTAASDDLSSQAGWRSVRAKVLARRRDFEQAIALAREADAMVSPLDFYYFSGCVLMDCAEAYRFAGLDGDARSAAQRALAFFEAKGDVVDAARAQTFLDERAV